MLRLYAISVTWNEKVPGGVATKSTSAYGLHPNLDEAVGSSVLLARKTFPNGYGHSAVASQIADDFVLRAARILLNEQYKEDAP
jgi:hypothetical protein